MDIRLHPWSLFLVGSNQPLSPFSEMLPQVFSPWVGRRGLHFDSCATRGLRLKRQPSPHTPLRSSRRWKRWRLLNAQVKRKRATLTASTRWAPRLSDYTLAPFMIHELLPSFTDTAFGSYPCCVVSFTAMPQTKRISWESGPIWVQ